jgi:putative redox protein
MNVTVKRADNKKFHLIAKNTTGNEIHMDANPALGGENKGARPMEMLLMALGGCSAIDIINILNKQRSNEFELEIEINGQRQTGKEPSPFEMIDILFIFNGKLEIEKVKRAVNLSVEKYCSVAKTLEKTAQINYRIKLNNQML